MLGKESLFLFSLFMLLLTLGEESLLLKVKDNESLSLFSLFTLLTLGEESLLLKVKGNKSLSLFSLFTLLTLSLLYRFSSGAACLEIICGTIVCTYAAAAEVLGWWPPYSTA